MLTKHNIEYLTSKGKHFRCYTKRTRTQVSLGTGKCLELKLPFKFILA